jgi:superfamily I DNA and/or RNA helicase
MFQSLSDTIGEIFYGAPFVVKKNNAINDNELPGIFGKHSERLLFMDVDDAVEGKRNKSFSNTKEAKIAADCLTELLNSGADAVAITPYKGQLAEIRSHLPDVHHKFVRTVDGFQGKEANFIVLSLVRNNKRTGSPRRWGFFRDPRRINVALSRSREGLLVVSSMNHIKNTDWGANEGQLTRFVESVERKGKIIQEGGK